MASTTLDISNKPQSDRNKLWYGLVLIWHGVLSLAAIGGLIAVWTAPQAETLVFWQRSLISILFVLLLVGNVVIGIQFPKRKHRARFLSLIINFFGTAFFLAYSLHISGFFINAFSTLADNMMDTLPYIGLIIGGIAVMAQANRYVANPRVEGAIRTIGRLLLGIGVLGALWVGVLSKGDPTIFSDTTPASIVAVLAILLLFYAAFHIMWRPTTARDFNASLKDIETLDGLLFISPNLLGLGIFFAGPLLFSLYVSFTDWDLFQAPNWVGLANYAELFNLTIGRLANSEQLARQVIDITLYSELFRFNFFGSHYVVGAEDKFFWVTVYNTLRYSLMVVPLSVIPALFLANLLNSKIPGIGFFRAIYFLPSIAAVVGIALIWSYMYNATVGWINYFISSSVEFVNTIGIPLTTDMNVLWLTDKNTALLAVVIMVAWQSIGFNTVLFLAGLQGIPITLYEAGTVDGATSWHKFRYITVPMLSPTTFFVVTNSIIASFQVFAAVAALMGTDRIGGPQDAALVMVSYLHRKGFQEFQLGYASAIAWVMVLLIFVITLLNFIRQRED